MDHKRRKELTSVFSGHTLIILIVSEEQKECGGVKGMMMMMMFGISPMSFHHLFSLWI